MGQQKRFNRGKRLSGRNQIQPLFVRGKLHRIDWLGLVVLPNKLKITRFGCVIRRKAIPQPVVRNRIKRWLREAFRRNQERFPQGWDIMAVTFSLPEKMDFQRVESTLLGLGRLLELEPSFSFKRSSSIKGLP